jgi:hypothetical protein
VSNLTELEVYRLRTIRHVESRRVEFLESGEFRKQLEHARFGAIYCRFAKRKSAGAGGEKNK